MMHDSSSVKFTWSVGPGPAAGGAGHGRQVEPVDDFHHEARQVEFGQPFVHGGRQQKSSAAVYRTEVTHGGLAVGQGTL
jgi:hypothetical protein